MYLRAAIFILLFSLPMNAQERDSAELISEVRIDAYRKPAKLINSTKSVTVASSNFLNQNTPDRLLESINLLPGSKMEERSPGSYRFSIRGSTLRSPFGVRNVKIYLDDFSLSDASGNTYLNILDPEVLGEIEIYKGPEGGDFGSATGGTALLKTKIDPANSFGVSAGSYSHFKGNVSYAENVRNHFFHLYSSYETTNSYRDQAALERKFLFLKDRFTYSGNNQFQAMLLLSDLHYETPGGLTFEQWATNPRQARPGTISLPGAEAQQAGIYNKMIFAGVSNLVNFTEEFSYFAALQGTYNDFRNPFITNYEKRFERNFTVRAHLNFEKTAAKSFYQTRLGFEGASAKGILRNFDNVAGQPANPQSFDDVATESGFVFLSQKAEFWNRLFFDISGSLNLNSYRWESHFPAQESGVRKFKNHFLPNFGVCYSLGKGFSVRGKFSKGHSAPTTEEIRSSAQEINPNLDPEFGWNLETGIRKQWGKLLITEIAVFDFRLQNAIVRRQNAEGQEYFVNAGGTVQRGLEFLIETRTIEINTAFLNSFKFYLSGNFYDFTFKNYRQNVNDFSGNRLTGVPSTSLQNLISVEVFNKVNIDLAHYYNSFIPLNDANTVAAKPSLIGNISFVYPIKSRNFDVDLKMRVQNLYNTKYSLGYDINAFGGRYYNAAAPRNYMVGINFKLK